MFVFIFLSLYLGFLLEDESLFRSLLSSSYSLYFGIFLQIANFLAACLKFEKIGFKFRYDLFAVGSILVWFAYWPPFFRFGSPIFDALPVYFAFITSAVSILYITNKRSVDPDALVWLQWLSDSGRFNPLIIMLGTMISLVLPEHFLLFPVAITMWVMRFALACSLNNE